MEQLLTHVVHIRMVQCHHFPTGIVVDIRYVMVAQPGGYGLHLTRMAIVHVDQAGHGVTFSDNQLIVVGGVLWVLKEPAHRSGGHASKIVGHMSGRGTIDGRINLSHHEVLLPGRFVG